MNILLFLGGLAALIVGAELLVRGASKLALSFGISPLVVGLTIVAFGTSSPEIAVSVGAALDGRTEIAVGNVVGSNIFNVLFILGLSALIVPLVVHSQIIRQEVPVMIGVSLLLLALGLDGRLGLLDGALLLGVALAYTGYLIVQSRRATAEERAEFEAEAQPAEKGAWDAHWAAQLGLIAAGLTALVFGSDWLVTAAVHFAKALGVSKGERDIAVGNVVGSNIFNIAGCLGITALVAPAALGVPMPASVMNFDIWVMLAVAVACLPVFLTGREIAAYVAYLILATQQHDALPAFSAVMMGFVLPLTVITLVVVTIRRAPSEGGR